jgi:hypothetical protein
MIGLIFVVFTCLLKNIDANQTIIVPTNYGDILGYETDKARIFYGIPFAEPPIGDLRYVIDENVYLISIIQMA